MKIYFYEYKDKDFEASSPLEVANMIFDEALYNTELQEIVLKAIADKLVNEYEKEEKVTNPYEEEYFHYFDEGWNRYRRYKDV